METTHEHQTQHLWSACIHPGQELKLISLTLQLQHNIPYCTWMRVHREAPDGLGTLFSQAFWKLDLFHKPSEEHNYLLIRKSWSKTLFP